MSPVKVRPAFALTSPEKSAGGRTVIIYKATNRFNNRAYIGQTEKPLGVRRHEHEQRARLGGVPDTQGNFPGFGAERKSMNHCRHFYNILRPYPESFDWEVLAEVPWSDRHKAEREMIRTHETLTTQKPGGYNVEPGGETEFVHKAGKPVNYRADIRIEDIVRLRQAGKSHADIARELGCDKSLVRRRLKNAPVNCQR